MKKSKHKRLGKGAFKKSLRHIKPGILIIMLVDFLGYFLIFLSLSIFDGLIQKISNADLPDDILQLSEQQIAELSSTMQAYYNYIIFLIIALSLVIILIWIISRAVLWRISLEKKLSLKYIRTAIYLGLVWFGAGIVGLTIGRIVFLTLKAPFNFYALIIYLVIYLILFVYLSNVLFLKFAKIGKFNIFKEIFKEINSRNLWKAFGFIALGFILLFFAILGITFIILLISYNLFPASMGDATFYTSAQIISVIGFLFYLACSRFYFIEAKKRG